MVSLENGKSIGRPAVDEPPWLWLADEGWVPRRRIVAICWVESAPIRRLLAQTEATRIVTMTGGRRRQSVVILDSGHLLVTALTLRQWREQLFISGEPR